MRNMVRVSVLLAVMLLAVTACGLLQEPEEASAPIEAIPLEPAAEEPESEPASVEEEAPAEAEEPTAYPAPAEDEVAQDSGDADAYPAPDGEAQTETGTLRIYEISQAESEVRFVIDEDLRGQRNTVTGVTDQLAGEIAVDLSDLASTQVGTIQINARTLATDNNFRNRAIQNQILDTGGFEFITFSPTSVDGLPASAATGDEVTFTISGDLTIRDITQPVVFTVTATAVSESQLTGSASAVVQRADYDLRIPSVPNVANVEEEVELYIDFVANEK